MFRRVLLVLLFPLLAACQTLQGGGGGTASREDMFQPAYLKQNLHANKMTVEDVFKLFGEPHSKSDDANGPTSWAYYENRYTRPGEVMSRALGVVGIGGGVASSAYHASQGDRNSRTLMVFFDKGRVSGYSLSH